MSKTKQNLWAAFAGESQANRKYLAFANKAEQEKLPYVARLFRAIAEAETVHAHSHLKVLKAVGSSQENLQAAIAGETEEFTNMYPQMIKDAESENDKGAILSFQHANETEKVHAEMFKKALANPQQDSVPIYLCKICGYIHENSAPDNCPVCTAKSTVFQLID